MAKRKVLRKRSSGAILPMFPQLVARTDEFEVVEIDTSPPRRRGRPPKQKPTPAQALPADSDIDDLVAGLEGENSK